MWHVSKCSTCTQQPEGLMHLIWIPAPLDINCRPTQTPLQPAHWGTLFTLHDRIMAKHIYFSDAIIRPKLTSSPKVMPFHLHPLCWSPFYASNGMSIHMPSPWNAMPCMWICKDVFNPPTGNTWRNPSPPDLWLGLSEGQQHFTLAPWP